MELVPNHYKLAKMQQLEDQFVHYKCIYLEQVKENKCVVGLIVVLVQPHPPISLFINHVGASNKTIIVTKSEQPHP